MTVYVDNFRTPARVNGIRSRWSHLTADTREELHEFAERIGLKREWFQDKAQPNGLRVHWHYDVTDPKRNEAIAAGAQAIDIREFGALISARRKAARAAGEAS